MVEEDDEICVEKIINKGKRKIALIMKIVQFEDEKEKDDEAGPIRCKVHEKEDLTHLSLAGC